MKFKSISIFAGILALVVAAPIAAQACGDKGGRNSEFNPPAPPEGTETSSVVDSRFSA